ncbi:MAG: FAD-dependent oxidoreductase [Eggerthellaceae bacterium]|nr:FAD-dependent oxidoreductase [Eggerthellaceae bacterium]
MSGTDFGRREFLKLAGAVAAGSAVSAALVGCGAAGGQESSGGSATGDRVLGWTDVEFAHDVDVLVIGAGPSGLAAAYTAAKAGANTLCVEKQLSYGGDAANAANGWVAPESKVCADLRPEEAITMEDCLAAFKATYADNQYYYEVVEAWQYGLDSWFSTVVYDFGVKFMEGGHPCSYGGFFLPPDGVGEASEIWGTIFENVQAAGAQFIFNMKADTFIVGENDQITGLRCWDSANSKWVDIKAKSIIIATGGFASNQEMIAKYYPEYYNKGCITSTSMGEGINLGLSVGAATYGIEGGVLPDGNQGAWGPCNYNPHLENIHVAQTMGRSFSILPTTGKRFYDETMVHEAPFECLGAGAYSWWAIWDDQITYGPNAKSVQRAGDEWVTGNTVEELATKMKMPVNVIQEVFDDYARICENGVDDEFGRTMFLENLEPPYYALQVYPVRYKTHGGLKVSKLDEVLDTNDQPIPGLYAAGVAAGTVHILPAGGSGVVAGQAAADYAASL